MDIKYDTILRPPESARGKILSRGRSPVRRATIAAPRQTGRGGPHVCDQPGRKQQEPWEPVSSLLIILSWTSNQRKGSKYMKSL